MNQRENELKLSCSNLINTKNCKLQIKLINEPQQLPDNPTIEWNRQLCLTLILNFLKQNSIDCLITFDKHGISSHKNHCFIYDLIRTHKHLFLIENIYFLKTVNRLRKYLFLFDLIPTLLNSRNLIIAINSPQDYLCTFQSMLKHKTQLVWFRWFYLITSRYMFINSLERLN